MVGRNMPRTSDNATATRALLLVNSRARGGALPLEEVRAVFRDAGVELVEPATSGDLADQVRQAGNVAMVVVGGGDGTLHSVAPALVERRLPLGILPLGTANDLARTLEDRKSTRLNSSH